MTILDLELDEDMLLHVESRVRPSLWTPGDHARASQVKGLIKEAVDKIGEISRIRAVHTIMPVEFLNGREIHTRAGSIMSRRFARLASGSTGELFVVFLIATLGQRASSLAEDQETLLSRLVFDCVLSETIEIVVQRLEEALHRDMAVCSREMTSRFSPGYCDWPLEGQRVVFSALDASSIDVELNDYCVMVPAKSISCVFLAASSVPSATPCTFCPLEDCAWRRDTHTGEF
ncbi:MAG TPA: hypothetical protein ENN34_08345 [Deltaproteobacteria bacterium]|nr:hypothetical protein [Deltaproteobacteria bacterium]